MCRDKGVKQTQIFISVKFIPGCLSFLFGEFFFKFVLQQRVVFVVGDNVTFLFSEQFS